MFYVMGLLLNKFAECGQPPWMIHRWDIFLFWLGSGPFCIQILRGFIAIRYFFQSINILIIDTAVQGNVKCPDHHDFRALPVVYLYSLEVQHPIVAVLKPDAMSTVYRAFV